MDYAKSGDRTIGITEATILSNAIAGCVPKITIVDDESDTALHLELHHTKLPTIMPMFGVLVTGAPMDGVMLVAANTFQMKITFSTYLHPDDVQPIRSSKFISIIDTDDDGQRREYKIPIKCAHSE